MIAAAEELLERLAELGASVSPDGDRLVVCAGSSGIPAALMVRLRAAKPDVITALASVTHTRKTDSGKTSDAADVAWWHRRFATRTSHWELGGYRSHLEAQCIAFNELLDKFRERHGRRWSRWQCAGCDEPIRDLPVLTLADEHHIHFDEGSECLIRFGRRWRSNAIAGLRALGLKPPSGFELP